MKKYDIISYEEYERQKKKKLSKSLEERNKTYNLIEQGVIKQWKRNK